MLSVLIANETNLLFFSLYLPELFLEISFVLVHIYNANIKIIDRQAKNTPIQFV